MKFLLKKTYCITFLLVVSFFIVNLTVRAEQSDQLIVLDASSVQVNFYTNISINGLIRDSDNKDILIYADGSYLGLANISKKGAELSAFDFKGELPNKELPYELLLFTKNKNTGEFSEPVTVYDRKISQITEAPKNEPENSNKSTINSQQIKKETVDTEKQTILVPPRLNSTKLSVNDKINVIEIFGFTKNKGSINFYLDNNYYGNLPEVDIKSENTEFNYTIKGELDRGTHSIKATITDDKGSESQYSNTLFFSVLSPQITNSSNNTQEIKKSDNKPTSTEGEVGSINKKAPIINFAIFLIFLLAIIFWLFFINRELTKKDNEEQKID